MPNLEVRLSWSGLQSSNDILRLLLQHKLKGEVFGGACTVKNNGGDMCLETCALLRLYAIDKGTFLYVFWPDLKQHFKLTCAHVKELSADFSGCIADYAAASRCPHSQSASAAVGAAAETWLLGSDATDQV